MHTSPDTTTSHSTSGKPLISQTSINYFLLLDCSAHGIEFFLAGAAAMTDTLSSSPSSAELIWSGSGYSAFSNLNAGQNFLNIVYVRWDGVVVYNFTLYTPRHLVENVSWSCRVESWTNESSPDLGDQDQENNGTLSDQNETSSDISHKVGAAGPSNLFVGTITSLLVSGFAVLFVAGVVTYKLRSKKNPADFESLSDADLVEEEIVVDTV
jgi:hypothetical protein